MSKILQSMSCITCLKLVDDLSSFFLKNIGYFCLKRGCILAYSFSSRYVSHCNIILLAHMYMVGGFNCHLSVLHILVSISSMVLGAYFPLVDVANLLTDSGCCYYSFAAMYMDAAPTSCRSPFWMLGHLVK